MKGFTIPNISIPKVSIPNISFSGGNIDAGAIKSAINSALPNLSEISKNVDLKSASSNLLSENGGIEIPEELKKVISK